MVIPSIPASTTLRASRNFINVKWKFSTHGYVISSPAIDAGAAYVGSTDGNLYAVDLATGAQKWKFKTEARITSSPAVAQGTVYFGSYDGKFYAVDAATGTLKWKFQTAGEHRFTAKHLHGSLPEAEAMPDPFDFYLSSPALTGGRRLFWQRRWQCVFARRRNREAELEVSDR